MSVLRQTPSVEANFFKDRAFVDQRFAGANVWQIYKVTNRKGKQFTAAHRHISKMYRRKPKHLFSCARWERA
jgi:hypothetical protein